MRRTGCSGSRSSSRRSSGSRAPGCPSARQARSTGSSSPRRPERDLAREDPRHAYIPRGRGGRRPARLRALLRPARRGRSPRRRARLGGDLRRRLARLGDGRGGARPGGAVAGALPSPRDPTGRRRRRLEHLARAGAVPRFPGPVRRGLRDTFVGGVRVRRHRVTETFRLPMRATKPSSRSSPALPRCWAPHRS